MQAVEAHFLLACNGFCYNASSAVAAATPASSSVAARLPVVGCPAADPGGGGDPALDPEPDAGTLSMYARHACTRNERWRLVREERTRCTQTHSGEAGAAKQAEGRIAPCAQ